MDKVLLVFHLMVAAGLVGVVLLQRSEGGGLGTSSNQSSFLTGRGTANLLTRTTAALAGIFFLTSIALTLLAKHNAKTPSPLDLPSLPPIKSSGPTPPGKAAEKPAAAAPAAKKAEPAPAVPGSTPLPDKAKSPPAEKK